MKDKIVMCKLGCESENELQKRNENGEIIVSQGSSLLKNATDLRSEDSDFSEKIKEIISKTGTQYSKVENIHLYASGYFLTSGIYRVCHIKDEPNRKRVIIKEAHDVKVSTFSGYWNILRSLLRENKIECDNKGIIKISYDQVSCLVKAINKIEINAKENKYKLKKYGKDEIGGYYYNKVMWTSK